MPATSPISFLSFISHVFLFSSYAPFVAHWHSVFVSVYLALTVVALGHPFTKPPNINCSFIEMNAVRTAVSRVCGRCASVTTTTLVTLHLCGQGRKRNFMEKKYSLLRSV